MITALALLAAAATTAPHPLTARDVQSMDRVGAAVVSPDGRTVVFPVVSTDVDANKRSSSLWRVAADGSDLRRLTDAAGAKDGEPHFSPDGKWVWFVSNRSGVYQVYRIAIDGGEAEKMTDEPQDVANLAISPDGKTLAYSMDAFPDCADAACTKKRLDDAAAKKSTGQLYDSMFVRHWDTWANGTRTHLFTRPAPAAPSVASVDVMKGMDADSPSKPFGDATEYTFTPDSKSLVFSARDVGPSEPWSTNFDLYLAPVDGSAKPRDLTAANLAWDTHPMFSPDGKTLAYLAAKQPGAESDRLRIMTMAWPGGAPKSIAENFQTDPGEIVWTHDGRAFLVCGDDHGRRSLFSVDAASGKPTKLVSDAHAREPIPAGARFDRIVLGIEDLRHPNELFSVKLDGSDRRPLTRFNAERLAAIAMGEPSEITFTGAHGDTVHAWIVKPAGFEASKKYPIAFLIHGGPQGSWDDDFHYRWNAEIFAGRGYGVIEVDFHASTGYGDAFEQAIRDDWTGAPMEDLQKGLAAAIAQNPWMDGDHACALGASYGGYLIDWIAGAWPDRFRCLVSHDGNLDERDAYFMTEELWFPEWEHRGTPWDNPEGYSKANPIDHVGSWKAPILIVHGGHDYRIADAQGLAAFTAAQRRGIPSQLLYFPDENHWVLKPQNSIQWYDTVLAWCDRWAKSTTAAKTP